MAYCHTHRHTNRLHPPNVDDNHAWLLWWGLIQVKYDYRLTTATHQQNQSWSISATGSRHLPFTTCLFVCLPFSLSLIQLRDNHTPTHTHKWNARPLMCPVHRFPQLILWSEALIFGGELLCFRTPQAAFEFYYLSLSVTGPTREGNTRENKAHLLLFFDTAPQTTERAQCQRKF